MIKSNSCFVLCAFLAVAIDELKEGKGLCPDTPIIIVELNSRLTDCVLRILGHII